MNGLEYRLKEEVELSGAEIVAWLRETGSENGTHLLGCIIDDGELDDDWYILEVTDDFSFQLTNGSSDRKLSVHKVQSSTIIVENKEHIILDQILPRRPKEAKEVSEAKAFLKSSKVNPELFDTKESLLAVARIISGQINNEELSYEDGNILKKYSIPRKNTHGVVDNLLSSWIKLREKKSVDLQARLTYATFLRHVDQPRKALELTEIIFSDQKIEDKRLHGMVFVSRAACLLDIKDLEKAEFNLHKAFQLGMNDHADKVWQRLQKEKEEYC